MGSVVAGAGVNPADQRWGFWPLLLLNSQLQKQFESPICQLFPRAKSYGFLRGWHSVIEKVLAPVSLAKQIETNIGWFGP